MSTDHEPAAVFSPAWIQWRERVDLDEYDRRWDEAEAAGEAIHGEADFVDSLTSHTTVAILDAGCGTGRVGIELARRGHDVCGVDLDPDLLDRARRRAPEMRWVCSDLATLELRRSFQVVAMAGNVLPFARPGARADVVRSLVSHLDDGGLLVAGFSLPAADRPNWPSEDQYNAWCSEQQLTSVEIWSSWGRDPIEDDPTYRVFVHRK